jgi:hypothetical protein
MLLVSTARATQQSQSSAVAQGIRSISHKESRVMFHVPSESAATGTKAGGDSPAMMTVKNLLSHFTRYWI